MTVWGLELCVTVTRGGFERVLREESSFVLATNVLLERGQEREAADRRTLEAYDGQNHAERCFRWTKDPLEVAPIFLKKPSRIAALGLVYVVTLMVYALIQRDVRARLAERGEEMPGNKGWTARPTTEVIFRLFEGIGTFCPGGGQPTLVTGLNTEQVRLFDLIGCDVLRQPGVEHVEPREPRPGERAFKPVKRVLKKMPEIQS